MAADSLLQKCDMETRYATRQDVRLILQFIKELAEYEHMLDEVIADEKILEEWIFDKQKAGVYLEDLFVRPEYRGKGYGKGIHKTYI